MHALESVEVTCMHDTWATGANCVRICATIVRRGRGGGGGDAEWVRLGASLARAWSGFWGIWAMILVVEGLKYDVRQFGAEKLRFGREKGPNVHRVIPVRSAGRRGLLLPIFGAVCDM